MINNLLIKLGLKGAEKTKKGLKGVGGAVKGLTSSMLKAGAVIYGAKGLITGMQKTVQLGGQFQSVNKAFNNLAKANKMGAESFKKLDQALNGTVGKVEIMTQANNAMLLGIFKGVPDAETEMAKMFDTAQKLAQAVGQDASYGIESLTTGLGRQSKMMLDNLGIMVDTEELYKNHADAIGKKVSALTDEEKKTAFVTGALAKATEMANGLGEETLTSSQRIARLTTTMTDLATEIGVAVAPAVGKMADMTVIAIEKVTEFAKSIDWKGTFENLLNSVDLIFSSIKQLVIIYFDFIPDYVKNSVIPAFIKAWDVFRGWTDYLYGLIVTPTILVFQLTGTAMLKHFTIAWSKVKNLFITGINFIKVLFNELSDTWVGQKMGLMPIELTDMIDTDKIGADYNKTIKDLKTQLGGTAIGGTIASIITGAGEDNIKSNEDFTNAIAGVYKNLWNTIKVDKKTALPEGISGDDTGNGGETPQQTWLEKWKESYAGRVEALKEHQEKINEVNSIAMGQFSAMTNAMSAEVDARYQNELSNLQDSAKYRNADAEQRADMEKDLSKKFAGERLKLWRMNKASQVSQAIMGISQSIIKALELGPFMGPVMASIVGAMGAVQLNAIKQTKPPKFARGGMVGGNRHSAGGTMIEAEAGEFVMNRGAVQRLGANNLANMNAGGSGTTINISAPMLDDTVADSIIPKIKEAVRRGADIGL